MLPDLLAEIQRQGDYEPGAGPEPVVSLELFFEGNEDPASIGCNLSDHPGAQRFFAVLRQLREQPDVQDVRVGISEVLGDDAWPFSDHVYVVTSASAGEVQRRVGVLRSEPDVRSGWWNDAPPAMRVPVPQGMRLLTLWRD